MKVGQFYQYNWGSTRRQSSRLGFVQFEVTEVTPVYIYVKYANGSHDHFSIGSPMHKNSFEITSITSKDESNAT